ncbi:MAG: serine hydrolase [Acidobacteria bacterium]|nr:serine hydrolase [Acidobacteriota bacterium]
MDRLQDETGLTGVTVAVMTDGQLAGVAAAGERRRGSGIPVTVDDRWHVGSITKSMTATLLAVLEDDGRLSRDDTLPALLPDIGMAGGWDACTLHHLLTHTAGAGVDLPNRVQSIWPDTAEELVAARRRFIADILDKEPESPCGERFAYSNVGYTIAGHIAETVAGTPYEALLQERVFAPLMLASAGFGPPQGDAPNQEPIGHVVLLRWFRLRADPFKTRADNSPVTSPAGAVHMTIGDLARFGEAHLQGESATSPPLLPRAAWERLHTPFLDDYASGWVRVERDWAGGPVLWQTAATRCGTPCSCSCPPGTLCWRSRPTTVRYRRPRPRSSSWLGSWAAGRHQHPDRRRSGRMTPSAPTARRPAGPPTGPHRGSTTRQAGHPRRNGCRLVYRIPTSSDPNMAPATRDGAWGMSATRACRLRQAGPGLAQGT